MIAISTGSQRPLNRTAFQAAMFLRRIEREHAAAMYRWTLPENIAWAARRGTSYAAAQGFSMEARR